MKIRDIYISLATGLKSPLCLETHLLYRVRFSIEIQQYILSINRKVSILMRFEDLLIFPNTKYYGWDRKRETGPVAGRYHQRLRLIMTACIQLAELSIINFHCSWKKKQIKSEIKHGDGDNKQLKSCR